MRQMDKKHVPKLYILESWMESINIYGVFGHPTYFGVEWTIIVYSIFGSHIIIV